MICRLMIAAQIVYNALYSKVSLQTINGFDSIDEWFQRGASGERRKRLKFTNSGEKRSHSSAFVELANKPALDIPMTTTMDYRNIIFNGFCRRHSRDTPDSNTAACQS